MPKRSSSPALSLPELQPLLDEADHVDVKIATGDVDLRTFMAGFFNYQPAWLVSLFVVRTLFARVLGMRSKLSRSGKTLTPQMVPMQVGKRASIFTVRKAEEEHYWIADSNARHLKATLGVVVEPLDGQQKRFHVVTIVHYHNWRGPVYFEVIRPFHHLVVARMTQAGIK